MSIAGKVDSELSIETAKAGYHIVTDNTVLKDLTLTKPDTEPFKDPLIKIGLDMVVDFDEKTFEINEMQVEGSQIKISSDKFSRTQKDGQIRLAGEFEAEYDLASVATVASAFIPEGLTMQGKRKDTIKIESQYLAEQEDGAIKNLNAELDFGFDRAKYMGLNFGPTEMKVKIDKGMMTIGPFSSAVNNGTVRFGAAADFNEEPTMLKTLGPMQIIDKVTINDETTRKMLMYLNPIFAGAVNVSGVANLHCEKMSIPLRGGDKNNIVVIGTVGMEHVRMQASDFLGQIVSFVGDRRAEITIMPTKFVLQNGVLSYDDMQVNVGDKPVNFSGMSVLK